MYEHKSQRLAPKKVYYRRLMSNAVYAAGILLIVFAGFSVFYLKQPLGWNHGLGFAFIALGAFFVFHEWS